MLAQGAGTEKLFSGEDSVVNVKLRSPQGKAPQQYPPARAFTPILAVLSPGAPRHPPTCSVTPLAGGCPRQGRRKTNQGVLKELKTWKAKPGKGRALVSAG